MHTILLTAAIMVLVFSAMVIEPNPTSGVKHCKVERHLTSVKQICE